MDNNVPISFRPVRLTERMLQKIGKNTTDGYLYFTTDTQKIYMALPEGGAISMGGNTGIYYGNKEIEYTDDGNEPNPEVIFYLDPTNESNSEIEGTRLPQKDDLILNIDGCFYRVMSLLDEVSVRTNRITLQGTGSSSGGGGEGSATLRITAPGGRDKFYSSGTDSIVIDIMAFSSDATNYVSQIECSFDKNFLNSFLTYNLNHPMEKAYEIDLISQKAQFSNISKKVYVRITDRYGVVRSLDYSITLVSLEISQIENVILPITGARFTYKCVIGGNNGVSDRRIEYRFYDEDEVEITECAQFYNLETNQIGTTPKDINVTNLPHGSYLMKVALTGYIGNTLITSNILSHKIIRYDSEIGQPIFTYLLPTRFEQYTDIEINYMLVYGDSQKTYVLNIQVNDENFATQNIVTNELTSYTFSFDKAGSYKISMQIADLNIDEVFHIEVTSYTGILPVININRDDLKVYLTAKGRSNNAADKEKWPDLKNNLLYGTLSNFYYRNVNGWMTDEQGVNYLKVSQGAQVELNSFSPFNDQPTTNGLTIELDFMIDGVLDYNKNLIECLSRHTDGTIKTGFAVNGDSFKYYASGTELVSLNLVEQQRIKLSFTIEPKNVTYPMCYTYLNGIISKVINYKSNHDFTNNPAHPGYLKIDSTGGQINIYNIRMYSSALDEMTILNNYQATIGSLEERQKNYEENLIRDLSGDIDLALIEAGKYNLQIPYVKITGGYQADKYFQMSKKSDGNVPSLPVGKKDYRSIDIEIVYPKSHQNIYFKDYQDFKVTTTFEDTSLNVLNGFENIPVEGAIMYAQGTSSLEYPVKNLRVKLKQKKFTVRPDIAPVELVTFKADFMESAGAHNTGAANYIDDLYSGIDLETPGQTYFKDKNVGTIVTCIKGHPCVIFWNPGVDKDGNELSRDAKNYQFIGKYNFNLDKATPEPFGFMHDDTNFGYDVQGEEKTNSIYCFEFLDNNEKVCNFIHDEESTYVNYNVSDPKDKVYEINDKTEQERYYDSWYSQRINEDGDIVHGWMRGFESRYPEDKGGLQDADVLFSLASWINELYAMRYIENREQEAIQKFKDEYQGYLDQEFLLAYYLITEVLLMADSRVKNMMIATWGKETRSWTTDSGENRSVHNYIWYPIFYDMDTMLGLDNIGYVNKNYYDEDTDPKVFNGDEILWEFVRDALPNELAQMYDRIEQSREKSFTKATIVPYFNKNQATMANETFYNEDAFYKYIDTFRNGYIDHLHDKVIAPGTGSRLYAAQGNRAMMREFFIDNRIRYLRGKYFSTNYQEGDRLEFRLTYPTYVEVPNLPDSSLTESQIEQKLINASIAAVPPSGSFAYKSMRTGYAGVKVGTSTRNYRFSGTQDRILTVETSSGNGTETYLLGMSNLSDVGDLSDKYLYKLIIGASQNNLKKLILGNHNKDYYNPFWKNEESIELKGFRFLEEFNLENCKTFKGSIDFTESPQIKKVLLNGSSISSLVLPVGGVLEELRLPTSLTDLYIDSHPDLTNNKFTLGFFDYNLNTYVNDFSKLVHVALIGVPRVDSYNLIKSIVLAETNNLETFCFQDFTWNITSPSDLSYNIPLNVTLEEGQTRQVTGIKVLDILLGSTKAAYEGYTKAEALTGSIVVNVDGANINEFTLYQKYHSLCPNLTISYGDSVNLQEAAEIKFYNTDNISEGLLPYYSVLSDGSKNLSTLTSLDGPAGEQLPTPQKLATHDTVYTFSGTWVVIDAAEESDIAVGTNIPQTSFGSIYPNADISLIPIFTSDDRLYEVILYNYDETPLIKKSFKYHTDLGSALRDNPQSYYNYRPYNGSKSNHRYEFRGWQSEYDFYNNTGVITYPTLDGKKVEGKLKLYAYYAEENCITTISNDNYFIYNGTELSINPIYKNILQGAITLPSKNKSGQNLLSLANNMLEKNELITDIYFLEGAQYERINYGALLECRNLVQLYNLPDTITHIGNLALQSCKNLRLSALPKSLREIGVGAFAFNSLMDITTLPPELTKIEQQAFLQCTNILINEFGTNTSGPKLIKIASNAFGNAGKNVNGIVYIGKELGVDEPYLTIESGAFNNYGGSIDAVRVATSLHPNSNPGEFGFVTTSITQQ